MPLERVGFEPGDESDRTQLLTLPSATPVFATQPASLSKMPIF